MKTLNSFIIKISFAAQTGEKICLSREHWLMVFRYKSPRKGTETRENNTQEFDNWDLDIRVPGRGRKLCLPLFLYLVFSDLDIRVPGRGRKLY